MRKALLMLLLCGLYNIVSAQNRPLTGRVVNNENGTALSGASITLKGAGAGVVSDADGKFTIAVPAKKTTTLVISSVGFASQEITVSDATSNLVVKLNSDVKALDDIVVVGYGEKRKRDVTGALSSIQSKDIARANPVQAAKAIQGQIAGATVTKSSNRPGAPFAITLRGENTINNSTAPLIVIDGLIGGDLNTLNPNDIQSMDVLKDASSTAIYGARGANGVVIVTTKKGISGKPRVAYDAYVGKKFIDHVPKMMNTAQFYKLLYTDRIAAGLTATTFTAAEQSNIDNNITTDWSKLITENALQHAHNLSVSGGNDKTTYRFSAGLLNENGNVLYTYFKRYNINAGLESKLGDHVKVGFTSYVSYADQNYGDQESLRGAYRARPTGVPYYADIANPSQNGEVNVNGYAVWMGINDKQVPNPLLDILPENSKLQTTSINTLANAYVEVELLKGLAFRTSLSGSYNTSQVGDWRGMWSKTQIGAKPRTQLDNRKMGNYTIDNILTYKKEFGKHKIDFTGLQEAFYQRDELASISVNNLPFNSYWYALNTGTITAQTSSLTERTISSYMGRVNYSYNDRYMLTLTGREDGASQLADGHKWAFFPSVALGWRIGDEGFMQKQNVVSNLKLRASYGQVGNAVVAPYSTQANLLNTAYDFDNVAANGFAPANLANKDLKWERSKELNIGLDFGVLKNRITASVEYYNRKTVDLILNQKIPTATGFNQVTANVGSIQNRGVELTLNTINIAKTDFRWTSTITFTKNNNKLLELYGDGQTEDKVNKLFVGKPIRGNFDYQFAGIWQTSEAAQATGYGQVPGSVKVVDQNNDGKISAATGIDDRVYLGTQLPNWLGGITNKFNYKNFDLSFFLYYRNGTQYANATLAGTFGELNNRYNSLASLNYWTKDNPSNSYFSPFVTNTYRSAITYQKASFLRVSDITFGYTLPQNLRDKWKLVNARFYVQVTNPFIFTKYTGFDPEFNSAIYQDDVPSMLVTFGLNVSL